MGGYFITLCTHQRAELFGRIVENAMVLNEYGHVVLDEWMETAIIRPGVLLDEFIVMPNHFHAIVFLPNATEFDAVGAHRVPFGQDAPSGPGTAPQRAPKPLGAMIAGFKSTVTTQINMLRASPHTPVWQRNYYEHIIRDDEGLRCVREYIANKAAAWETDDEHWARIGNP